ncbi:MAG: hypothetical protein K2F90_04330 [Clostridiales bacterium]|nr:hypothetical protein [Clostridiales bacterium]
MNDKKQENAKKPNGFVRFLKAVFVHNIGWKILSIVSAAVIWALAAGLL